MDSVQSALSPPNPFASLAATFDPGADRATDSPGSHLNSHTVKTRTEPQNTKAVPITIRKPIKGFRLTSGSILIPR